MILAARPSRAIWRNSSRGTAREFLAFSLAGELYGVELTGIKEILSPPPLTLVPRSERAVIGVCSVRGLLVTVFDLRRVLRVEESPPTKRTRILLCQTNEGEIVGLLVDEVRQVMRIKEGELELATSVLGGDVSDHVVGIARPEGLVFVVLDLSTMVGS